MVPPFDHEWIVAGQGTVGLEILDQLPQVGTVLVPIGGGGLISGVAAAIKLTKPSVQIVGRRASGAASMKASIDAGHVVTLERTHSIADGLMAVRPGSLNFAHVQRFVDRIVTVDDAGDCRRGGVDVHESRRPRGAERRHRRRRRACGRRRVRPSGRRCGQRRQPGSGVRITAAE